MTDDNGTYSRLAEIAEETTNRSKVRPVERPVDRLTDRPTDPSTRPIDHRAYDFFRDQISWLNRQRLELKERYGRQVPATVMVQLALDLFIRDFEEQGEDSQLVRVLIKGERPTTRPEAGQRPEEDGDG